MKTIVIGALVITVAAASVWAGGNHGHAEPHSNAGKATSHADGARASAVGRTASSGEATQTVRVDLLDSMKIHFKDTLKIEQGYVVRFLITNKGSLRHQFSIGDVQEQKTHAYMMRKLPGMVHSDGDTVTVESGETKELIWRVEGDAVVVFACNIPGHFEAGMFSINQITQ
jgi:uncharacterized cupredoxin-like copper-binding protein